MVEYLVGVRLALELVLSPLDFDHMRVDFLLHLLKLARQTVHFSLLQREKERDSE